ncbi:MAG: general stress protein CsbD [Thalassobius sp.]|nr:general stress protein CsbD [Thalassovita sp.]
MSNTSTELKLKGSWNETKGKLKQKWGFLTDNDLAVQEGRYDEVVGKIQKKTGESKEAIISYIQSI